jgi:hypothetical protein
LLYSWKPLFTQDDSEPYQKTIDEILDAIDGERDLNWGKPLLHAYLATARQSHMHRALARDLVDDAVGAVGHAPLGPPLYGGFTGVAWLSAHIESVFGETDDDAYEDVDEAVTAACTSLTEPFQYDLISGCVGWGVYFLERLPHPRAVYGLA